MKRSEAISQLAGYLSTYAWYEEKHPSDLIELATHALTGAEKIGMIPPTVMYHTTGEYGPVKEALQIAEIDLESKWQEEE